MVQQFNPANVMTTQSVPSDVATTIIDRIMGQSAILQVAKNIDMQGKQTKKFSFMTGVGGAYWTGETQRIATTKPTFLPAKLEAKKLAVIIPVSKEFLSYSYTNFFSEVTPLIVEQMDKAIDLAVIKGINTPYADSLANAAQTNGSVLSGDINYENILALENKLYDKGLQGNAFLSTLTNNPALRTSIQQNAGLYPDKLYDSSAKTLDGMPVVDTQQGVLNKGDLVFGNFDYLYYGLPGNMDVEIDKSAQLSTMTNTDGTPVNLFEQDMVAMKVTMDIAVLPVRQDAFATLNVKPGDEVLGAVPGDGTDTTDKNAKANTAKAKPATATSSEQK